VIGNSELKTVRNLARQTVGWTLPNERSFTKEKPRSRQTDDIVKCSVYFQTIAVCPHDAVAARVVKAAGRIAMRLMESPAGARRILRRRGA
jgi:hypothetical protein